MQKSLDTKLAEIHADPVGSQAFILADAKDADMAFGMGSAGVSPERHFGETRFKTLAEYREQIRQIIKQGLVDIVLMSASTNAQLTLVERLFDESAITPAGRANDASDVFVTRGGSYLEEPARPFRSAALDHLQCGHLDCALSERERGANLGLYSVTFNNRLEEDLRTLEEYKAFREEAERKGFRHFLEVFDPNAPHQLAADMIPKFINDQIARTLAGVAPAGRPVFLKIVYHGPRAMEELVAYDPHLIVGILGGSAGTTYDAFKMLAEAKKYGARAALYGRKINQAENQLAFIEFLKLIADDMISPEEGVRAYHGVLQKLGVRPQRSLAEDLELRTNAMSYAGRGGSARTQALISLPPSDGTGKDLATTEPHNACGCGGQVETACHCVEQKDAKPEFAKMTTAEKLAYNQAKRDKIWGRFAR
jgi:hypothetical protein